MPIEIPALPLPSVYPLGVILFDFLFLLVAIPIEAYILNTRLRFDKKTSIFYAISINLISSVVGWVAFFIAEPLLPKDLRTELISYAFFNKFQSNTVPPLLIFTALIIFFGTFILKFFILKGLLVLLSEPEKAPKDPENFKQRNTIRASRAKLQNTSVVTTTLIANSLSYSAIAIILLLRVR
jgi:hypothetical protein